MDEQPVTRLGPDSGGRMPGAGGSTGGSAGPGGPDVHVYSWEWGPDEARRPGLPWIGIFLLVFGTLLLIQQAFPQAESAGSLVVLAVGLAFLIKWAIDRGTGSLYAGALITALAVPGVLNAAGIGIDVDGIGTFCFGVAFLFIAAVRALSGGGWGWQLWFGGLLALIGGVNIASPTFGDWIVPVLLITLGGVLLMGSASRRRA